MIYLQLNPSLYSYYPPNGVAYYFSPTGEQLRRLPKYNVVKTSKSQIFDDNPLVDKQHTKNYPGVSHGCYGYMFVYFCPIHGHSYGFHVINRSEGRKMLLQLCTNISKQFLNICFMTLPASCQNTV